MYWLVHYRPKKKPVRPARVSKGLRHFSVKVCEKLSETKETTYNDIANILVQESKPTQAERVRQAPKILF